ncbi:MAG: histone [Promethearchaeota archaeon]
MAKRKRVFAWSPVRELMKKTGAEIVSRDAVDVLLYYLEERAKNLTATALKLAKHSKRKKITAEDMKLAIQMD